MNTSASAIADGLITMFSAASQFGSGNVSKNSYQVMETSAGSCLIVQWTGYSHRPQVFGSPANTRRTWRMNLKCYIRDTGNPVATLNRVWTATDNILNCLYADDTLQGTVDMLTSVEANRDPETAYTAGGATWLPIEYNLEAICI